MKSKQLKIIVTVVIALAGIGYVAGQSLKDVTYYKKAEEVVADPGPWLAKHQMKVHGFVKPGTIKTEVVDQRTHRSFLLEDVKGNVTILVKHSGPVADTFKDQAEAVVTGKLTKEGDLLVLTALDGDAGIAAKCPSKYEGDQRR
jgi:cytochrome c-type biogenesis protein CcmE